MKVSSLIKNVIFLLAIFTTSAKSQNTSPMIGTWDVEVLATQISPMFGKNVEGPWNFKMNISNPNDNIYVSDRYHLTFEQLGNTNVYKVYWEGPEAIFTKKNVGPAVLYRAYLVNNSSMDFTIQLPYSRASLVFPGQGDWVKTFIQFSLIKTR